MNNPLNDHKIIIEEATYRPESEALADEAELLTKDIKILTERLGGLIYTDRRIRAERHQKLYEARREKMLRLQEIYKIALDKGYIEA